LETLGATLARAVEGSDVGAPESATAQCAHGLLRGAADQVRQAIEGVRALLPLVEAELGPDAARIREALSQLQMVYAQSVGQGDPEAQDGGEQQPPPAPKPGEAGPAQSSGRLWIPGQ
jgi:hypothetical protein